MFPSLLLALYSGRRLGSCQTPFLVLDTEPLPSLVAELWLL